MGQLLAVEEWDTSRTVAALAFEKARVDASAGRGGAESVEVQAVLAILSSGLVD